MIIHSRFSVYHMDYYIQIKLEFYLIDMWTKWEFKGDSVKIQISIVKLTLELP
jgi:hypothetical protein